jgi:hypothetical protein
VTGGLNSEEAEEAAVVSEVTEATDYKETVIAEPPGQATVDPVVVKAGCPTCRCAETRAFPGMTLEWHCFPRLMAALPRSSLRAPVKPFRDCVEVLCKIRRCLDPTTLQCSPLNRQYHQTTVRRPAPRLTSICGSCLPNVALRCLLQDWRP